MILITRLLCAVAGRSGTAASRYSELSESPSRVFDELEAIAPRSTSCLSLDDEASDSSASSPPDTGNRHTEPQVLHCCYCGAARGLYFTRELSSPMAARPRNILSAVCCCSFSSSNVSIRHASLPL